TTYLGNQLHQLPGAFLMAAPFVLLGTSALQNLFWLAAFFWAMRVEANSKRLALALWLLVLVGRPTVLHQVVTGTGHLSNAIYVTLGLTWLTRTTHRYAAAAGWGVALASRVNFMLLLPAAAGWLYQTCGAKVAARAVFITIAVCASLCLPFYFNDPGH